MTKAIKRIECVICDIDNVYTDSRVWNKNLPEVSSRESWDFYHTFHYLVRPNKKMISKIVEISKYLPILFVTSREDRNNMRALTIKEIEEFSGGMIKIGLLHKLYMRECNCYEPSHVVKEDILINQIFTREFNPVMAIDDEPSNIEMFKKYDIPTKLYNIYED